LRCDDDIDVDECQSIMPIAIQINFHQIQQLPYIIYILSLNAIIIITLELGHSRRGLVRPYYCNLIGQKKIHTFTLRLGLPYWGWQ